MTPIGDDLFETTITMPAGARGGEWNVVVRAAYDGRNKYATYAGPAVYAATNGEEFLRPPPVRRQLSLVTPGASGAGRARARGRRRRPSRTGRRRTMPSYCCRASRR